MNFPKITLKSKFPSQMLPQSPRESLPEDSPPFWRPPAELDFFIFTNCISQYHISDLWTGIFSVGSHEIDQCNLSLPLFHTFSAIQRQIQIQRQWQWQIHLENTLKEQSLRLVTFETFAQSDEKTLSIWPKWATTMTKTKTMTNAFREHPERAIFETTTKTKTMTITNTFREHLQKTIL